MATKIIHKKSSVASSIPAAGDLEPGEIAVNLADQKLYSKTTGGTVIELAPNDDQLALTENCKNVSGGSLAIGTPVYQSGTAGNAMEVQKALSGTAASMPAVGLLSSTLADEAEGTIVLSGFLQGLNTSTFSEGDTLYVSATGTLTTTVPAGEANLIQNIGKVIKVHASNGSIMVTGAGRANATPNLDDGNIFIGNASNQSVTASFNDTVDAHLNYSTATSGQILSYDGSDYDWIDAGSGSGDLVSTNNLSDLANAGTARTNLGLGTSDSPTFDDLTATGDITTDGDIVLGTTGNSVISNDLTDKIMTVSGGSGSTLGANLRLYGEAHGSNPNNFLVRAGTSVELKYDDTASSWDFQANDITTTGDVTATAFAGDGSALTGITASGSTTQGAVGTYAFAGTVTAADYAFGATIAGSSLRPAGISSTGWAGTGMVAPYNHGRQNTALSGTWRSMGRAEYTSVGGGGRGGGATVHYFGATLWVRIS